MRIFLLITKTTGFPSLLYWVTVEAPAKVEIGTSGFSRKPSTNLRGVRVCQNYLLKHLTRAYMASTKTLHFSL